MWLDENITYEELVLKNLPFRESQECGDNNGTVLKRQSNVEKEFLRSRFVFPAFASLFGFQESRIT